MIGQYEEAVINYLLGRREVCKTMVLLPALCDAFAHDVSESVRDRVCPFCGRRFRTFGGLRIHIAKPSSRNPCAMKFMGLVKYIVGVYVGLRRKMLRVVRRPERERGAEVQELPRAGRVYKEQSEDY